MKSLQPMHLVVGERQAESIKNRGNEMREAKSQVLQDYPTPLFRAVNNHAIDCVSQMNSSDIT